uniref:F-box/kelch-repeat protein At3g06240-like n=1 Tax=Erigeron canadensis TaxID=72917 RepID=UPI001CB92972|nr:F-box/kelch-repeat protein At3g06240-like [Erigeron canadensis]
MSAHNLPPEIIESILRVLPAKSLGRFKSVSKPWCSLISTPKFIKSHLVHQNHNTTKLILLISDSNSLYSLDINSHNLSATAKQLNFGPNTIEFEEILGSCNGIVLAKDKDDTILLINPTTKEIFRILVSPFALPVRESFVMYGFGHNSSNDDYVVISISFWDTDNEYNPDCTDMYVSMYSLRNGLWRRLDCSPYDHAVGHLVSGVLVNEKLHWLTSVPRRGYSSIIAAFSLESEEFEEIELPDMVDKNKGVFNELVDLGGKLCMFGSQESNDFWVMEEYGVGESWRKIYIHGVEIDPVKPVCGKNGDIVFGDEDGVLVYDIDEKRCSNVRIEGGPNGFVVGGSYFESLESLKRRL